MMMNRSAVWPVMGPSDCGQVEEGQGGESTSVETPVPGVTPPFLVLAGLLKRDTGIDPLTMTQSACQSPAPLTLAELSFSVAGSHAGARNPQPSDHGSDISIHLGVERLSLDGRAGWLAALGRRAVPLSSGLHPSGAHPSGPYLSGMAATEQSRIIEAFPEGEPEGAAPLDRLYLARGETLPLALTPGHYKIKVLTADQSSTERWSVPDPKAR